MNKTSIRIPPVMWRQMESHFGLGEAAGNGSGQEQVGYIFAAPCEGVRLVRIVSIAPPCRPKRAACRPKRPVP